jgi:hypothetical protein
MSHFKEQTVLPMQSVRLTLGILLSADTHTLAPTTTPNKMALTNTNVTPSEVLTIASLSFATTAGMGPIAGAAGTQGIGNDPATGDQTITILTPAGGWRFVCTAAPATPETIYGFALTNNGGTALLAYALLPQPVNIAAVGDEIDLGAVTIVFVRQPMF